MKLFATMATATALIFAASAAFAGGGQIPPKAGYTIIDLGNQVPTRSDGTLAHSSAVAINDGGEVAINADTGTYAYQDGTLKDVAFMGSDSFAQKVNGVGQVLALSFTESGVSTYTQNWSGFSSVTPNFFGQGLNDSGDIAGSVQGDSGSTAVVRSNGHMLTYPSLDPSGLSDFGLSLDSQASDINNAGVSTGSYSLYANDGSWGISGAWIARGSYFLELDGLGGDFTFPSDINNGSFVVGGAATESGDYLAFLWSPRSRRSLDLGSLGGFSYAEAINDLNQVVGQSGVGDPEMGISHGFIWKSNRMTDLNNLIDPRLDVTVVDASGINRSGQIAATIMTADGQYHAALLNPTMGKIISRH